MKRSHSLLLSLFGVTAVTLVVAGAVRSAHAENFVEIYPARVGVGSELDQGGFRWRIETKAMSGKIETKDILITTDGLFEAELGESAKFQELASKVFKVGAIEALLKGGHVGMGFRGVSFGEDPDRGYSKLLKAGLYALVNIIQKDGEHLGIRSGYDFERIRNAQGEQVQRNQLTEEAVMQWNSGPWTAMVNAFIGINPEHLIDGLHEGAGARVRSRIKNINEFLELGASVGVSVDHDPLREELGLNPTTFSGTLMMDISYVQRKHSN